MRKQNANWGALVILAWAVGACAPVGMPRDVLEKSHASQLLKLAKDFALPAALEVKLKQLDGGRLVVVDMESPTHINDESMDYMLMDVLKQRISTDFANVAFVERDMDVLSILQQEMSEIEIKKFKYDDEISMTDTERRAKVAGFLRSIAKGLSANDAVLFKDENAHREDGVTQNMASNEIGGNKLELFRTLITEMKRLYPTSEDIRSDSLTVEKVKLLEGTHILGFRIYDFGNLLFPDGRKTERKTHLRIYFELLEVQSGQILYSGHTEKTAIDEIRTVSAPYYQRVVPRTYDFSRPNMKKGRKNTDSAPDLFPIVKH